MGAEVDRAEYAAADYAAYDHRLRECLEVLGGLLATPGFGAGPASIGAEVEGSLVDGRGRLAHLSRAVQDRLGDPRVVSELAAFNIEANLGARPCGGLSLAVLEGELTEVTRRIDAAAREVGGRLVLSGIVPSTRLEDVGPDAVTDETRYHALEAGLVRLRGLPITLVIDGPEPLTVAVRSVAVEGASTSWQLHLRVPPERFVATYDAARLATLVALPACVNAPFLDGHRLWDETRIALFRQAVDSRGAAALPPFSRVGYGDGWLAGSTYDLFAAAVAQHPAIIPMVADRPPREDLAPGGAPRLAELRLHMGTVWSWNRPVYDPADGGHVRIELRALPSGPTPVDMVAGATFLLGLTLGLAPRAAELVAALPFERARRSFEAGARRGLDAEVLWPGEGGGLVELRARELAEQLLPVAQAGLDAAGFDRTDTVPRLAVVAERLRTGRTGAAWTVARAAALEQRHDRAEALRRTTLDYAELDSRGEPVHTWPAAP